ncbi:MAG: type II toxin-antitoxin system VapC family toxin [Candidatus Micrarchaeaceae archaeon]
MIILDASALVKLVVDEEHSDIAREIYKKELAMREIILVPYLALPESLNTIWKYHTLKKKLSDREYESTLDDLFSIFNKLEKVQESSIAKLASEIAHVHKLPVYDAIYIAISRLRSAPLLTFDKLIARRSKELEVKLAWEPK